MRILVTGGGTGGHIYPALSLIKEIKKENPKAEFLYVGTQNGLESQIVPAANIPFETIDIQGIKRSISIENIKTMYLFFKGLRESKKILKNFQPDIVLGTGGYVCGPVVYQASKMGIPTIIHEQNSVPGITNKFLSRYVKKVCVCFPEAISYFPTEKVVLTGNPRAQEVAGIPKSTVFSQFSLDPNKKTVVIFGGSRGAKTINEAFLDAFNEFDDKDYQVLYISGKYYYPQVMERMKTLKNLTNVSVQEYVNNMEEILVNTSLVVGRAGATSIAEITSLGIPSILIPSPNVTNDHQTKNAQSLVNVGAAILIKDNELNGKVLVQEIDKVMNADSLREKMSQASKEQGLPHAADTIYQLMLDIQN